MNKLLLSTISLMALTSHYSDAMAATVSKSTSTPVPTPVPVVIAAPSATAAPAMMMRATSVTPASTPVPTSTISVTATSNLTKCTICPSTPLPTAGPTPSRTFAPTPTPVQALTTSQLTTIYTALVSQGIASGILPSNFNSLVAVNYTPTTNTGLVSYTRASGSTPATINIGGGIYTTAEAQMLISHALGIAQSQPLEATVIADQNTVNAPGQITYGTFGTQTVSAVNALETSADVIGAKLMGAQNFINGLSSLQTYGADDTVTLFDRAVLIAQNNPGVVLSIPGNIVPSLVAGQPAPATFNLEYTLLNGVPTLNSAVDSSSVAALIAADRAQITKWDSANGTRPDPQNLYGVDVVDAELNGGASDLVGVGVAAFAPSLTQAQLSSIYTALVNQGIAAGILPSNFNSLVTVTSTGTPVTGLVSFTPATNSVVGGTIQMGTGITSVAEAQSLIAHAIGIAHSQTGYTAAIITAEQTYGVWSPQAVAAVNAEETQADIMAVKLLGATNFLNGLAAFVSNERWEPNGEQATTKDTLTMFSRVNALAQAMPGTVFTVPAALIPQGFITGGLTLEYTLVNGVSTLNPNVTTSQNATNVNTVMFDEKVNLASYSSNPAGYASYLEYNNGGKDIANVGLAAAPTYLTGSNTLTLPLNTIYNNLVSQGIAAGILPANFTSTVAVNFTGTGMAGYTAAGGGTGATITIGGGFTSTAEAQTMIAHAIGVSQSQALQMAAQAAEAQYGISSSQAITAVNNLEAAADAIGAKIVGVQNYMNGLAALENAEISANASGSGSELFPSDENTLIYREQLLAKANPGTEYTINPVLLPNYAAAANPVPFTFGYTLVNGTPTLNTSWTNATTTAILNSTDSFITSNTNANQPVIAEINNGGSDITNIGVAAPQTSLTASQLSAIYTTLVNQGIAAKLLPSNFTSLVTASFPGTSVIGTVSYTPATGTTGGTIQVGSGITSTAEAQMLIAHELGIAESQTLETAATTAASTYGLLSSQAITAINALESAADVIGAKLIGAQSYINGLSAYENGEIAAAAAGSAPQPTDATTLFDRAQLIAQANNGVTLTINPNLAPGGTTGNTALTIQYTNVNGTEALNNTFTSPTVASLVTNVTTTLAAQVTAGIPSAEFNNGAQDAIGLGDNADTGSTLGITFAWEAAEKIALAAGVDPAFLANLNQTFTIDPNGGTYTDPANDPVTITAGGYLTGFSLGYTIAGLLHEIGHALTPNELNAADLANNIYNDANNAATLALAEYGQNSQQYQAAAATAAADLVIAQQANLLAENAATITAANLAGNSAAAQGQSYQNGVQSFINALYQYTDVPDGPNSENQHGTFLQQITAVAEANPDISLTIPNSVIEQALNLPDGSLDQLSFTVKGDQVSWSAAPGSPLTTLPDDQTPVEIDSDVDHAVTAAALANIAANGGNVPTLDVNPDDQSTPVNDGGSGTDGSNDGGGDNSGDTGYGDGGDYSYDGGDGGDGSDGCDSGDGDCSSYGY